MTLRQSIYRISPPWLQDDVGGSILRSIGTTLDGLAARTNEAVKLRFPEVTTPTALGYIGNDRLIERPPNQTSQGYAKQLREAFDTWRNAGGARTILTQLRLYFTPATAPVMRAVSNNAVWHEINNITGVVTRTEVGDNWNWDGNPRWWRGWIIIQGSGFWNLDYWDNIGTWGDGGVWGSDMSEGDATSLNRIVKKWKPANVIAQIIVTFNSTLFERTDTAPPNPNGLGEDSAWRAPLEANFFEPLET